MGILDNLRSKDPLDAKIAQYEKLSTQKTEDAGLKNALGDLYLKKGNLDSAAKNYTDALRLFSTQRQDSKTIALIKKTIPNSLIENSLIEALINSFLEKGLKKESVEIYSLLAKQSMKTGSEDASDIFERILKLDPENREARAYFDSRAETSERKSPESVAMAADDRKDSVKTEETKTPAMNADLLETEPQSVKDKFLAVAKEKGFLENVLAQQNELIKQIDKEKNALIKRLKLLAADNKKLNQKLVDLDTVRGHEIEELKGQIHAKLPKEEFTLKEKFRAVEKEKDALKVQLSSAVSELEKAKKAGPGIDNISFSEQVVAYESEINDLKKDIDDLTSSMEQKINENEEIKEKDKQILRREKKLTDDIANLKAKIAQKDDQLEKKAEEHKKHYADLLAYHKDNFIALEGERDTLRTKLAGLSQELTALKQEKTGVDEVLEEKEAGYEREIAELKKDVDELTVSMEEKVRESEEAQERKQELVSREKELTEKITTLEQQLAEKVTDLEQERAEEITGLEEQLGSREKELTEKITTLEQQLAEKDTALERTAAEHKEKYEELLSYHEESFSALEKERDDLRAEQSKMMDELTAFKAEKTGVYDVLEEKETDYAREIVSLKKDIDELTISMEEKIRVSEETQEREQALVSREKELTEEINSIRDELHEHEESFSALEKERDDLRAEQSNLTDELNALKAEKTGVYDVLEEKETGYEREIAELKRDIDELTLSVEDKVRASEEAQEREQALVSREKELTEKVNTLEQERAREITGLEEQLSEKDAALERTASEHKEKYEELLSYHQESFSAIEKERDGLQGELTRKDQMLSERADAQRKETDELEKRIREYETETQRFQDSVSELKNELEQSSRSKKVYEDQIVHVRDDFSKRESQSRERITQLTNELVQKEELFMEVVESHEREKQAMQSTINDFETAIKRHENETKTLNINIAGVKSQADEYLKMYQDVDNQRKELDERLSESLKNIYELKNENERQISVILSKEQDLLNLQQEFNLEVHSLNEKIERMNAEMDKQVTISSGKVEEMSQLAQEKADLLERVSASEGTFDRVRKEKEHEIAKMRDQLGTAFMKIGELENSLKVSLNANIDLRKKLEAKPESIYIEEDRTAEPLRAKPEPKPEPEPVPRPEIRDLIVYNEKKNWLTYVNYAFLFVLLIISLLILYRTFTFTSQPQRSSDLSALYDLTYDEVYTLLTRNQSTDNMKVQATMISELLMRRENAGRILSQFDFKGFYYLKININALKGSFSQKFIDNPREGILITDGAQEIRPPQGVALEEVKTFYKKDKPVSLSFLYIIPKDTTVSELEKLELVLSDRGEAVRMNWDIQKLKADKIIR
jgi:chromosome segregation ATPase